jgi:hypothetical protein
MLSRIRLAMQDETTGGKIGGPGIEIEADETMIGGKARNMHPGRRSKMRERGNFGKAIVSAVLERHGKVRATVVPNRRNGMENFWSLLKRSLKGTYVSVEPFHLWRYVDEHAFRFKNRQMDDVHRFVIGMRQIVGRRLTYAQLTGKAEVTQHG